MKTIFTILFIGILNANAQVPKNVNTIIVKGVTADQITQSLTDQNIPIKSTQAGGIYTDDFKYRSGSGIMHLFIRIKDSTALIIGFANPEVTIFNQRSSFYPVKSGGWKGSDMYNAFKRMQDIAESLKAEITYAKL